MDNISMAILELERNKTKNQIRKLNRKVTLLEKFMFDFPNADLEETRAYFSFLEHTDFDYETILEEMRKK